MDEKKYFYLAYMAEDGRLPDRRIRFDEDMNCQIFFMKQWVDFPAVLWSKVQDKQLATAETDGLMSASDFAKLQSVVLGCVGYFATPEALNEAFPTGTDGQFAIVGTTDTFWIWDSDTTAWKDSGTASIVTWASLTGKPTTIVLMKSGTVDDAGIITLSDETEVADLPIAGFVQFTAANEVQGVAAGDIYQKKLQSVVTDEQNPELLVSDCAVSEANGVYTLASGSLTGYERYWDNTNGSHWRVQYDSELSKWKIYRYQIYFASNSAENPWDVTSWTPWADAPTPSPTITLNNVVYDRISQFIAIGKEATTTKAGLMSAANVVKLNSLSAFEVSAEIWVDAAFTGETSDGTINKPYKTLSSAFAAINKNSAVHLATGTYTESGDLTLPNYGIVVYGNNSTVNINSGAGTITIPNPNFVRYDLNTIGNIVFSSSSAGRVLLQGGSVTGNINLSGLTDFKSITLANGIITVASTGQMLAIASTLTSRIVSTGVLLIENCNFNTGKTSPLITSTAGQIVIANNLIFNTSSGGCISCDNGATTTPNIIVNNFIFAASGAPVACGTANTVYGRNYISGTNTGTGFIPVNSDIIGGSVMMALGSDETGDIYCRNSSGLLVRIAPDTAGKFLKTLGPGNLPIWDYPSGLPTGTTVDFSGDVGSIPSGFLLRNGAEISRTTYSGLFGIIGTTYGEGDGSTTFEIPKSYADFDNLVNLDDTARTYSQITKLGSDFFASAGNEGVTGDIYKQTGGSGNFVALSQANQNWKGITAHGSDLYICSDSYNSSDGGQIYKQTGGSGDFVSLGQTSRRWRGLFSLGSDVYCGSVNGALYKQTGGTGDFVEFIPTISTVSFNGIVSLNGDVYVCGSSYNSTSDIYKQTGGSGEFTGLGTAKNWNALFVYDGDIYAVEVSGDIYRSINGVSAFVICNSGLGFSGPTILSGSSIFQAIFRYGINRRNITLKLIKY